MVFLEKLIIKLAGQEIRTYCFINGKFLNHVHTAIENHIYSVVCTPHTHTIFYSALTSTLWSPNWCFLLGFSGQNSVCNSHFLHWWCMFIYLIPSFNYMKMTNYEAQKSN
jgi:hypothetical protein